MVSDPDRCCSDDSPDNRQSCEADNPDRNSAGNPARNLPHSSEDSGRDDSENSLQGTLGHNSRNYPGDDGGDLPESGSTIQESGS